MPQLRALTASVLYDEEETISSRLARQSPLLESLEMSWEWDRLTHRTIEAMVTLSRLHELRLDCHFVDVTDEDIDLLARSLPALRNLVLQQHDRPEGHDGITCVTARGPFSFIRYCQHIEYLELVLKFDLSKFDSSDIDLGPSLAIAGARLVISCYLLPKDLQPLAHFFATRYRD
ncbi:hypothetical protein FRB98_005304 [Tulasnella sp. 332]|nr:hypothetical protein FRB98_005304 [Tulasnella sp. 332]